MHSENILYSKKIPCFGVAGNFTGHLEQAGEDKDFTKIKTSEAKAPKALFPTYIPLCENISEKKVPEFLHEFPFSADRIDFPAGEQKLQMESECAIICGVKWNNGKIISLKPEYFGASNDCSIRKEGAKKISLKKNWGKCTKGFAEKIIPVDSFDENGILSKYRIASYLVRNGNVFEYGEDSSVRDYSYIWNKLVDWCIDRFNNQKDEGPAEKINDYLIECGCPDHVMISIGATRYTEFGETNFLQDNDKTVIVLYPEDKYSRSDIMEFVSSDSLDKEGITFLNETIKF